VFFQSQSRVHARPCCNSQILCTHIYTHICVLNPKHHTLPAATLSLSWCIELKLTILHKERAAARTCLPRQVVRDLRLQLDGISGGVVAWVAVHPTRGVLGQSRQGRQVCELLTARQPQAKIVVFTLKDLPNVFMT